MSFLRKTPNKTINSLPILTSTLRRLATQSSAATNPFPDDPTSAYYDQLTTDAGLSGDLQALRDILNKRMQDRCLNTKRTFSFITDTSFSPSLLDDVVRTISSLNPGFTRKSAIESLVTRLCKLQRADDALRVIESMALEIGCTPSACTFYPVLKLLTSKSSIDDARRVVELMARLGVRVDLTTHNYFLMAHCAAGDMAAAADVLREMEKEGLTADARTFDALVLGACKVGKVEGAIVLVKRMVDDGVPLLYSTHMCVIRALLEMKCFEQAVRYVRSFSGKDEVLDTEIYGCLGSKLGMLNRVKEAMMVLKEMEQRGLPMGSKLRKFYEKNSAIVKGKE